MKPNARSNAGVWFLDFGGPNEDRTHDLRIANVKAYAYKSMLIAIQLLICHNIATS